MTTKTAIAQIAAQMIRAQRMPAIFGGDALGERINTIATAQGWDFTQTREAVAAARTIASAA